MMRTATAALAALLVSSGLALAAETPTNGSGTANPPQTAPLDTMKRQASSDDHAAHPAARLRIDEKMHRMAAEDDRYTHALNLLEAKGYTSFSNFRADGKNFDATVTRDGRPMTVMVDPDSGTITQKS